MTKTFDALARDDVLRTLATWHGEGRKAAIATVVSTWGSSPRPVGSQLGIDGDGNLTNFRVDQTFKPQMMTDNTIY